MTSESTPNTLLFPRSDNPPPESQTIVVLNVFFAFQLFGLAGLSIILLTAAITRAWKHPSWINFCVTWIISSISYCLLLGRPLHYVPPHQLCFAQAVLIYTVPTLTASATLSLVLHVFRMVKLTGEKEGRILTFSLVAFPYLAAAAMMAVSLVVALGDPTTVRRTQSGLYCNMGNELPGKLSAGVVTIVMLICIVLEVLISRTVKKQWSLLRASAQAAARRSSSSHNRHSRNSGSAVESKGSSNTSGDDLVRGNGSESGETGDKTNLIALTIKVFVFSLFSVFAVALGIIFTFTPRHAPALNIVLSLMPAAAALVFGAQRDLLFAWASAFHRLRDLVICRRSPNTRCHRLRLRQCHASTESQEKMVPISESVNLPTFPPRSVLEDC
ncbi:hypothetical protein VKT23_018566 [Stygiomarasmius scandens]|uniref:G-protein coupled receptors family 2 profile 2 domain-containing protein n=1 Tax=Marasmiellus scandens TaxID=2682957 RepID=A0ABR1IT46_9AGAR